MRPTVNSGNHTEEIQFEVKLRSRNNNAHFGILNRMYSAADCYIPVITKGIKISKIDSSMIKDYISDQSYMILFVF